MRKIFVGCCALAEPQSAKSMEQSANTVIFFFMFFSAPPLDTPHSPLFSLDHFIRSCQDVRRNGQTDLLRCLQVDDKFELRRLLYREISGLRAFQNLIHVSGGAPGLVGKTRTI